MKKITFIIVIFTFTASINFAFAQKFNHAVEYMEYISNSHEKIKKDMWDYMSAIARGKGVRKVESKRISLIKTTDKSLKEVKAMGAWGNSTEYRDSVVSYLNICSIVLKGDFEAILDMEEIAERSYDNMEAYLMAKEAANKKLEAASEMVQAAQQKFAVENGINLIERQTKIDEKIEASGPVFDYYNVVYLIFFKAYIQEAYLLEALNVGDISIAEQRKNAMIQFSEEGLSRIDTLHSYKGDMSILKACSQYLEFLKEEGEKHMPIILDFFLKKENFEKQKKAFEAKSPKNRTQEDVDNFNKAVNEYNAAIEDYNKTNQLLNNNRSQVLNKWNETISSFLDRHIPSKR